MEVYFNQNFWDIREGKKGITKKVNWEFTYENQQYYIPTIYQFQEGITIDIITILDTEKLKALSVKYEEKMAEEEALYLESVNPIEKLHLRRVFINNELAGYVSSCSACYVPGIHELEKDYILSQIKEEYDILKEDDISFQCIRVHIKFLKESQKNILELKFITERTEYIIPVNKRFTIDVEKQENEREIVFEHPLTGIRHSIYINEVNKRDARLSFENYDDNSPYNFVLVSYELEPSLPEGERLFLKEIKQLDEAAPNSNTATTIGVISGSTFGKHSYPLMSISTNLYRKSLKNIELSIVGIYKEKCPEKEILVCGL